MDKATEWNLRNWLRRNLENTPRLCIERLECPKCHTEDVYVHRFLERVFCHSCNHSISSGCPRLPGDGPRSIDYEEALLELAEKSPAEAMYVRDLAQAHADARE